MGDLGNKVANIFDEVAIWDHFQDLCAKVGVECKERHARAQAATQTGEWVVAYSEWTSCIHVIADSRSLLDPDSWIWFLGFHALVLANLGAFYSMNFGQALRAAMVAFKAGAEVQNEPEALDFKSYVLPTLWKVMYLWASTSDCEEEVLDPDVKEFLIDVLEHPRGSVSDSEVKTLKNQCKEFVINKFEFVIWDIWSHYFSYGNIEECLRWTREGSRLYNDRYSGNLDYESKFCEAVILLTSASWEDASQVLGKIKHSLESKPWKANARDVHPAALNCDPKFADVVNSMLCLCYEQMRQPCGQKIEDIKKRNEKAKKAMDKHQSLPQRELEGDKHLSLQQRALDEIFSSPVIEKCRAEVWEHTVNNRFEEAEACYQKFLETYPGPSLSKKVAASHISDLLYDHFRTNYRQSYESGSANEDHFSNAKKWAMKFLESNRYSLYRLPHWQPLSFMKLVELYHEKDRQVMYLKPSSNSRLLFNVNETAPILQYGKKVIECLVRALIQHTKQNDYWIFVQDMYMDVYYMLQFHNFALWIESSGCTLDRTCDIAFRGRLEQLWYQSLMPEGASAESSVSQEIWKQSLLWAERRCSKIIHFQLAPKMLSTSALEQLREFDLNDVLAWNTLKSSRAACGAGTVVLEYFFLEGKDLQFVYVMTKEDEVFMQILTNINRFSSSLGNTLERLRELFSQGSKATKDEREATNACLEWIYEMLISPVANLLDDMGQEDKLVIVAPEILSNVPFAALRKPNSPAGKGYLIQSHTICVTPSLRMLQHCNQRFKELNQGFPLDTKPGTIVAVGDPAYEERRRKNGKGIEDAEMSSVRLEGSGEEVKCIEGLFGKGHVKKLVGSEATPSEVLKWAKYPSENGVKQVVFHIAAHGIGQRDDGKVKKGAIVLALPDSSCQHNHGQRGVPTAQVDEDFDYDNAQDETELEELFFSMVDIKEVAQISSHAEVGSTRTEIIVPISKCSPGLLKSENISGCGFRWEAHMVVLSACDTARGQITGEGVLNLPRALMIAGVPCVVVSQWKVGDSSTYELMKGFYEELRSGKDVSSSLRGAMLKMMKCDSNVHEWAPFVVCGLPTICLPTELQDETSSWKGHDCGTSSDTKAERM